MSEKHFLFHPIMLYNLTVKNAIRKAWILMLRFYFVIIISLPLIIYYILRARYIMRHFDRYDDEYCYRVARNMVRKMMRNGRIKTKYYGLENLPKDGGYIMFPNHQGKFDALGIIYSHQKPCSIVIDKKRSQMILTNEFIGLLKGIRLDKEDMRQQMKSIKQMADEVKSGRRYILFPEGGYDHNQNKVQEFLPGAFKTALWSQKPIVPVALVDSYKPFELNSLSRVTTQVHFLKPLYYDDYKGLSTKEIAALVKESIQKAIENAPAV